MIAIASDHAGYQLRQELMNHLVIRQIEYRDFGCETTASVDYPDYAKKACDAVLSGEADAAVLICGTGVGISISANKIHGIRAAQCSDTFTARFSRLHNDANALCLGARVVGTGLACDIVDAFLAASFEGGRHQRRVDKIMALEKE